MMQFHFKKTWRGMVLTHYQRYPSDYAGVYTCTEEHAQNLIVDMNYLRQCKEQLDKLREEYPEKFV